MLSTNKTETFPIIWKCTQFTMWICCAECSSVLFHFVFSCFKQAAGDSWCGWFFFRSRQPAKCWRKRKVICNTISFWCSLSAISKIVMMSPFIRLNYRRVQQRNRVYVCECAKPLDVIVCTRETWETCAQIHSESKETKENILSSVDLYCHILNGKLMRHTTPFVYSTYHPQFTLAHVYQRHKTLQHNQREYRC